MPMKLLTKEILNKFPAIGATSEKAAEDVPIIAKFFMPGGSAVWYATEYDPETGEMFGFADMFYKSDCGELGYWEFNEIPRLRGQWGQKCERDMYFQATLAEVMAGRR